MNSSPNRAAATRLRRILCSFLLVAAIVTVVGAIGSSRAVGEREHSAYLDRYVAGPTPSCPPNTVLITVLDENFDGVNPPVLPPAWGSLIFGPLPLWETSNSGMPAPPAYSLPNSAFIDDPAVISDKQLVTSFTVKNGCCLQLTFRHNFNLEASNTNSSLGFDGGVLEVSIDAGPFQDILAAGGSFITGGYNRTISTDRGSPIAGRQAWSGNSEGFITTTVNVPIGPFGFDVLHWRMGSDTSGSNVGWRVDNVVLTACQYLPTPTPTATPTPSPGGSGTPTPTPSSPPNTPTATPSPAPTVSPTATATATVTPRTTPLPRPRPTHAPRPTP